MSKHTLLLEIGTEELPPKTLKQLATAFSNHIKDGLREAGLEFSEVTEGATARRLAVSVTELSSIQPDTVILKKGPAIKAAYSKTGDPTTAALGFAKACKVQPTELEIMETDKGQWLSYRMRQAGKPTPELIPDIANHALSKLPIRKKMRWGTGETEFVRPVHWVVALFGSTPIDCTLLNITAGRTSYGHRFHCPQPITLESADIYWQKLEETGRVIANFKQRKQRIKTDIDKAAGEIGGHVPIDDDLLDEVTALTEWPVVIIGVFDKKYLSLPGEILIATMKGHQKYFPIIDDQDRLCPHFIMVANIESRAPDVIRQGNQRVLAARLSDAEFFWRRDVAQPLENLRDRLHDVVFQKQLGSLHDKSKRIVALATHLADRCGFNKDLVERAGTLCKCDLLTETVNELPELQGIIGRHCAFAYGEDEEVALAIETQYMPRFADDQIPDTKTGKLLAIADKLDTLVGIFSLGMVPSGDKDPFALRRAALGVLRIIIEGQLADLDLKDCLEKAYMSYQETINDTHFDHRSRDQLLAFIMERLRNYYCDQGMTTDHFEAVLQRKPARPYDFHRRLNALMQFGKQPEAAALATTNKRIANILKQAPGNTTLTFDDALLQADAERKLAASLMRVEKKIAPLLECAEYQKIFQEFAALRPDVDRFFEETMVMCDDVELRKNRLALLNRLHRLLVSIADISKL